MAYNPVETFVLEADELLAAIEQSALSLAAGEGSDETIHQLFRAFHTIKGSGAMCGPEAVSGFTHHVESLLDGVRQGVVPVTPKLMELVLKARDHIKALLDADRGGEAPRAAASDALIAEIEEVAKSGTAQTSPEPVEAQPPAALARWQIRFHPHPALLANGGNPIALLHELRALGSCEVAAHTEAVPPLDAIEADRCYLWWSVALETAADRNAIRDVFIFVEDQGKLEIERVADDGTESAAPASEIVAPPAANTPSANGNGDPAPGASARHRTLAKETTVRVPSERLDRLVRLVGELVMNQSRLVQAASQSSGPDLANPVQELERLVAELRDNVLGIRMLPIGTLFGRFRRLVHDLAAELGKEADLATEGTETELDKSILDQLGEPLVHCLRNCLDHAIETPEDRVRRGKPRHATIRLSAAHLGSNVVVSVQDDGRGIDRAEVRAKAVEKQLIQADANLSDKDIFNLILLPGFSTARQVTSVSGRGVGMDAVKRQIDALRGSLCISSEEGKGCVVSITLPLTLAIIDGLLVGVGGDEFIIPMAAVTENVELIAAERARRNGRNVIAVRGELIPYIDLRRAFSVEGEPPPIEKVVIVHNDGDRVGLVVDRVIGTHQTVIQSLGKYFRNIEVVSGATIMGDGRVALIVDIAAVVRFADTQCQAGQAATGMGAEERAAGYRL